MDNKEKKYKSIIVILMITLIAVIIVFSAILIAKNIIEDTGKTQENANSIVKDETVEGNNKEQELNQELKDGEKFCITDYVKNLDNTYTIHGVIYTKNYTISKAELENLVKNKGMRIDGEQYDLINPSEQKSNISR